LEGTGFVADQAGRAVPGALVALDADSPLFGGPKGSGETNADGRFRIGFIAAGDDMLTATRPGLEPKPVTRQTPDTPWNTP
jgi:hypothetical protein